MLGQNFCETLEYKISEALENVKDENLKGFWCDGVLLSEPNKYYSQKFVNDNRQVKLQAFICKDEQTTYDLTLRLGNKSLSRYARNLDIVECIPQADFAKWFKIDTTKKEIEVQLD